MNFNKHTFTRDEFLNLPTFDTIREVDPETKFLLSSYLNKENVKVPSKMLLQKQNLVNMLMYLKDCSPVEKEQLMKKNIFKFVFWKKHKDGNVSELGGNIPMLNIEEGFDEIVKKVKNSNTDNITINTDNLSDYLIKIED